MEEEGELGGRRPRFPPHILRQGEKNIIIGLPPSFRCFCFPRSPSFCAILKRKQQSQSRGDDETRRGKKNIVILEVPFFLFLDRKKGEDNVPPSSSFLLPLFSASSGACNRYGKSHYLGNERGGGATWEISSPSQNGEEISGCAVKEVWGLHRGQLEAVGDGMIASASPPALVYMPCRQFVRNGKPI